MKSITILMNEHQLILRALTVARNMARHFTGSGEINMDDVKSWLDFVVNYSDKFHHLKEENVLFKWMCEKGFPENGGPLGCMLSEHSAGRGLIDNLKETLLSPYQRDPVEKINDVAQLLNQFAAHLEEHIAKEDNVLYPMARSLATEGDDEMLASRYQKASDGNESEKIDAKYTQMVAALEAKYVLNS